MTTTPRFLDLNEAQRRQQIDAESLFEALEAAEQEAWRHRGSMFWREQGGRTYLIKLSPDSSQRSLGTQSEQTQETYERFMSRKVVSEARVKDLREQVEVMKRMNRALRVGRAPDLLIEVLNALAKAGVAEHFLVVGTNALYAYEAAAGVRFPGEVMETRDADLLYDTSKRVEFLRVMQGRKLSFIDLLRKVDKTFERHGTDNYTAVNSKGYEVDLLRRFPPPEKAVEEHTLQITPNDEDLWPVRAPTGQRLLAVPRFSQVVVGTSGRMARMTTVHPMAFARIKRQLAVDPARDPRKAPKDAAQAEQVEELVLHYLPNLLATGADEPTTLS
ncbi:hypothetical protein EZ242_05430 [Ramlibacter rhizophilus]|uniref:Nucleotidyltransferase-like domain-containing protein n=1 Tax=Ramlibacter rhizophilus TaxID=1781167 RepID=A0A4Z0BYY9_9BURK|nr:hypothetical protein EZ242_05430 [Ramlibacter rhizophilus]